MSILAGTSLATGGVINESFFPPFVLSAGNVQWLPTSVSYGPGDSPGFSVDNGDFSVTASFTAQFYDVPVAPATYPGTSVYDSTSPFPQDSELDFVVPGAAQYVADLSLSGGAVTLSGGPSPQTFASSGLYPLGQVAAGVGTLTVTPVAGPPAQWSVRIRALPVSVYGAGFDSAYAPAGAIDTLRYSITGQATVAVTVSNAAGQLVRTINSGFSVGPGPQSLAWDGRDSTGNALPDGTYTATLSSTDPFGNLSSTSASITLDSTPPIVTMTSPGRITPTQGASFRVTDSGSGVSRITLLVDGRDIGDWGGNLSSLPTGGLISARGPWMTGTHSWAIHAIDNVGNQADVRGSFTAANPPPPIPAGVYAAGMFNSFAHRPSVLWLWASDALIKLRWANWGMPTTSGSGRETSHSRGRYTSRPAQVQLSRIQVCKRKRVYTHVRYRIVGQRWRIGHYSQSTCRLSG